MIQIENLSKSFGSQVLFEGVGLKINSKERIGLVGRNGHGKTTLLKILAGVEEADSGNVSMPKNYRIGFIRQNINFKENTVLDVCVGGLAGDESEHCWRAEKILTGLGFSETDFKRHPDEFSGGYQVRLNLAKILVSEPDLLLLDEPTNYLDITAIRWIERFLLNWSHELVLITHDRSLMDKLVTHTVGIHRKRMRKIPGNTEKYYTQMAQEEEIYEKTRQNDERRKKDLELFITRFRAKARLANMVQSRVKTLSKMEKKDKLEKLKTLDFSFRSLPYRGKTLMQIQDLSYAYPDQSALFETLTFNVQNNDRICVIGRNGRGKTTLLKIMAGVLPSRSGTVTYNPGVTQGFFEQTNISSLDDLKTVEEEILYSHEDVDRLMARNIGGAMMFDGDAALKKIAVLSGGEKSRVMLGKLLVTPVNVLLLDEPSNHLDMESCDALLAALDSFSGAVIMVTHNEMFLHALAKRLIIFQNDEARIFEGTYQDFLEKEGWQEETLVEKSSQKVSSDDCQPIKLSKKDIRKRRSDIMGRRAKIIKPFEIKIESAENAIDALEKTLKELHEAMQVASQNGDGEQIADLSRSIHQCETGIETHFNELENLTEQLESKAAPFDHELAEFEKLLCES